MYHLHVTPVSSVDNIQLAAAPGSPKAGSLQQLLLAHDSSDIPSSTWPTSDVDAANEAEDGSAQHSFHGYLDSLGSMDQAGDRSVEHSFRCNLDSLGSMDAVTATDFAEHADMESMDFAANVSPSISSPAAILRYGHIDGGSPSPSLSHLNSANDGTAVMHMAQGLHQAERQARHVISQPCQGPMLTPWHRKHHHHSSSLAMASEVMSPYAHGTGPAASRETGKAYHLTTLSSFNVGPMASRMSSSFSSIFCAGSSNLVKLHMVLHTSPVHHHDHH